MNAALLFFLAGCALLTLSSLQPKKAVVVLLASIITTISGLTMVELWMDQSLGIDFAGLHLWFDYDTSTSRLGRMAPNTAFGFFISGVALILTLRVQSVLRARLLIGATLLILLVGLTGLAGYGLMPDLIFGWTHFRRMPIPTALGMIAVSCALWFTWHQSDWYRSELLVRPEETIRFLGAAVVLSCSLTGGLSGFVLLQNAFVASLEASVNEEMEHRLSMLNTGQAVFMDARAALEESLNLRAAARLALAAPTGRSGDAVRKAFTYKANAAVRQGFSRIELVTAMNLHIAGSGGISDGRAEESDQITARLHSGIELVQSSQLVWRLREPIESVNSGELIIEKDTRSLAKALYSKNGIGKTGEVSVCRLENDVFFCFPNTRYPKVSRMAKQINTRHPYPMAFATSNGAPGNLRTNDYRDKSVYAAYAGIGQHVGIVVKQDSIEMFSPVRETLLTSALTIGVIGLFGSLLVYSQLSRLARRMRASERAAKDSQIQTNAILLSVTDAIVTMGEDGLLQEANPSAIGMFGYGEKSLVGTDLALLMPARYRERHSAGLKRYLNGGAPKAIGVGRLEMYGLKMDGTEFPLELSINVVHTSSDQRFFVGVMRDITERKIAEQKLKDLAQFDTLTKIPNRALFMDRLSVALARQSRNRNALAIMFFDLDEFKSINDNYGHQVGDSLLVAVAQRACTCVRLVDTVARLGGDEFTVILEDLSDPMFDAPIVANKIIKALSTSFLVADHSLNIGASVGCVVQWPLKVGQTVDPDELLAHADLLMYEAKKSGKGQLRMGYAGVDPKLINP